MSLSSQIPTPGHLLAAAARNPVGSVASGILILLVIVVVAGPALAPHDSLTSSPAMRLCLPSAQFPMGCDTLVRCLFSRIIYGAEPVLASGLLRLPFRPAWARPSSWWPDTSKAGPMKCSCASPTCSWPSPRWWRPLPWPASWARET